MDQIFNNSFIWALNPSRSPNPPDAPANSLIRRHTQHIEKTQIREKYAHAGQDCDSLSALQTDSEDCRPILGIISGRSWKQILYLCFLNHRNHRFKGGEFLEIVLLLQLQYLCRRGGPEV